ncbi:MAG: 4-hydroxyphenylacetate 3-hydroxylase N-terminal domain-containing protein, partial [Steroidobacteraceae bacterium]
MSGQSASNRHDGGGARRGAQVLQRLRERPPALWYQGERVADVTAHPAFKGGVHTLAALYDLQWGRPQISLYDSPSSGKQVARSFMMPRTQPELASVSAAMRVWEEYTHGMM